MKQTTLAIDLDRRSKPPVTPPAGHRRRLVELMAAAIVAVHRVSKEGEREDGVRSTRPARVGAYVYGRRPQQVRVVDGLLRKSQRSPVAPEQARVFLRDHHEGYIDWTNYEDNQRSIRNNGRGWERDESIGPARRGQGLLTGLLRCARCGRKLHVRYWGKSGTSARYLCQGDYESGGSYCLAFGGRRVDKRVTVEVLGVLSPLGIEASTEAIRRLEGEDDGRRALLDKQLEQVEYEARRAFEQYDRSMRATVSSPPSSKRGGTRSCTKSTRSRARSRSSTILTGR